MLVEMLLVLPFWVMLSVLVAWWSSRIGIGWWTGFVFSLVFSPLIGALMVGIMATPRRAAPDDSAARSANRVEPPLVRGALSAERMAEIEAEERYRAEVRARLAAERGDGGQG